MAKTVDKVLPAGTNTSGNSQQSSKRLPIVVCLDVSPSMFNYDRYINQIIALREFLKRIASVEKAWNVIEIAFVTFADDIILKTEFMPLWDLHFPDTVVTTTDTVTHTTYNGPQDSTMVVPAFEPLRRPACTELPRAVDHGLKMLQDRLLVLTKSYIGHYAPFLVVVTDGNPDSQDYRNLESAGYRDEEDKVYYRLKRWCDSMRPKDQLILPFFVGIGGEGVDFTSLQKLASALPSALCTVDDSEDSVYQLGKVFTAMAVAITKSITYTNTQQLLRLVEAEISKAKKQKS